MRKRTKSDAECEEYVCPMDTEVPVPLQKMLLPRQRKNDGLQNDLVTANQKTREKEQQVSEYNNDFLDHLSSSAVKSSVKFGC